MRWTKLDLHVPDDIRLVHQAVAKEAKKGTQVFVAGGSISDLYMGIDYRDIDVFLEDQDVSIEAVQRTLECPIEEAEEATFKDEIYEAFQRFARGSFNGRPFELIFVDTMARLADFDMRFRQFYYDGEAVYATQEALEDIASKRLTVVSFSRSVALRTLVRSCLFQERYGFEPDKKSHNLLYQYINQLNVTKSEWLSVVELFYGAGKLSDRLHHTLLKETGSFSSRGKFVLHSGSHGIPKNLKTALFDYANSRMSHTMYNGVFGLLHERIWSYKKGPLPDDFSFHPQPEDWVRGWIKLIPDLLKHYRKNRLRYSLDSDFEVMEMFETIMGVKEEEQLEWFVQHGESVWDAFKNRRELALYERIKPVRKSLQTEPMTISFSHDESEERLADIVDHRTFVMTISPVINRRAKMPWVMRKCDNGTFTLASLYNPPDAYNRTYHFMTLHAALHEVQKRYPEWFTFGDSSLNGLFSPLSGSEEYYFPEHSPYYVTRPAWEDCLKPLDTRQIPIDIVFDR